MCMRYRYIYNMQNVVPLSKMNKHSGSPENEDRQNWKSPALFAAGDYMQTSNSLTLEEQDSSKRDFRGYNNDLTA